MKIKSEMTVRTDPGKELTAALRRYITENYDLGSMSDEVLYSTVEKTVIENTSGMCMTLSEKVSITESVFSSIRGFGLIDMIMRDSTVTEVMINGYEDIFIEQKGRLRKLDAQFESPERLEDIIQRIVASAGREVNQANPIVDTRLPDGSRVNVVLPPVSLRGPAVTIRKFPDKPMTMEQLVACGSVSSETAGFLENLVRAGYNIFISGGTGSGKTTFLNVLSGYIPKDERIITIEDSAELKINGVENLVSLETRNANSAGSGEITMRDLIRSSLRMRPERIIVGEVRGAEALDMLQAMNTGHDGSLSTGHANSARDMMSRLETMVLTGSEGLPLHAVRQQIASAVDIVIHLSRMRDHTRKVTEISEVSGTGEDGVLLNPLYIFEEDENSTSDRVSGGLVRTANRFENTEKLRRCGTDAGKWQV